MKIFVFLTLFLVSIFAYEKQEACVQYKSDGVYSQKYKIKGYVYSGLELYEAANYRKMFDVLKYYLIIWWNEDEASIIKITDLYFGGQIFFELNGVDERGMKWKISNPDFCF